MQAADLGARLLAERAGVEAALTAVARGPAAEYVNVTGMRTAWQALQHNAGTQETIRAVTILMRGLHAGLFVNATMGA